MSNLGKSSFPLLGMLALHRTFGLSVALVLSGSDVGSGANAKSCKEFGLDPLDCDQGPRRLRGGVWDKGLKRAPDGAISTRRSGR